MRVLPALAVSAALATTGCGGNPARDLTQTGIPGAIVLTHDGVTAAGNVRADTRFRIASVTKTFVATIALQLVAEGKLSLDEPEARGSTRSRRSATPRRYVISVALLRWRS